MPLFSPVRFQGRRDGCSPGVQIVQMPEASRAMQGDDAVFFECDLGHDSAIEKIDVMFTSYGLYGRDGFEI